MSRYKIENKQIDNNDILRVADTLEEYKEEWLQRAKTEEEYISGIDQSKEYEGLETNATFELEFSDGRSVRGSDTSWLMENLLDIDNIIAVTMWTTITFSTRKSDNKYGDFHRLRIYIYINQSKFSKLDTIKIDVNSDLDDESKVVHTQLLNIKEEYENVEKLSAKDVMRFAKFLTGYEEEWKAKEQNEKQTLEHAPNNTKKAYEFLKANVEYTIEYYDGKYKTEKDYSWFKTEISNPKVIKDINIQFRLSYRDEKNDEGYKSVSADVDFHTDDYGYNSSAKYLVDSTNMEAEADTLYGKIDSVFRNNPTRYDSIIKRRSIITLAISTAIGIILSYIIYLIIRVGLGNSDGFFNTLINNKNIIVFGQWVVAILAGNACVSWFINALYKPMLPRKKYIGYSAKSRKTIYKDEVDEYIEDSEVQLGKYYDLRKKRELLKKMFKISLIAIAVQLVISIILFLVLK